MSENKPDVLDIEDMLDEAKQKAELLFLASHGLSVREEMNAFAHGVALLMEQIEETKLAVAGLRELQA
ncbi:hypothetical protein [Tianweitania sp.]|uniref:hypothetical protein n=1 Tax=Tianweitania sp. TaxID=2021634 RepID=UPI00289C8CFA|nr:hypothetical protein [Tianweitania sp.]